MTSKVLRGKEWLDHLKEVFDVGDDFYEKDHDCLLAHSIISDPHDLKNYSPDTGVVYGTGGAYQLH